MKKLTKLFACLVIFASSLMLTSCLFDWEATYDTWYRYIGGELDIPVVEKANADADSVASSATGDLKNAEFYVCFSPDKGLTVAVQSTKEQEISIAGGLLTTTANITTGGSKTYTGNQFGTIRWKLLYGTGLFVEDDTPKVIAKPEECIILAGDDETGGANKFDFHWKKVLRTILINQILGED